jgi:tryptophan-rich sensory protein
MRPRDRRSWIRNIDFGALAVIAVLAASVAGQLATAPNLVPWYAGLAKPSFNPPNWIFAPVWAVLYLLMALAVWRIMHLRPSPARRLALILFFIQLALNAAWSWMFFAAHSPLLGLVNIVPQFLVIVATVIAFARLDWIAGWSLVPLAAWVGYAGVLNAALWRLNG